jgi:hypothetical protein
VVIAGADRPRLPLMIGGLLFVLGLALALGRITSFGQAGALRLGAPWAMVDFRHVVYYPSRAFWDGMNPYNSGSYMERYPVDIPVSLYAPATFLLFAPFALLPLGASSTAYFVLTVALTLVLAWVALRLGSWQPAPAAVLSAGGMLLLSRPGHWNLLSGQVTIIVVLATYCALIFARRAPRLGGLGLALALLKPSFGVPLIPALLAKGGSKTVGWGLGLAAVLNLPIMGVLVWRERGLGNFVASVAQSVRAFASNPDTDPILGVWRVDLTACISRFLNYPLGAGTGLLVTAIVLAPVFLMSRRLSASDGSSQERVIDVLICCAVLLSLFHQAYDLLLLAFPAAVLARAIRDHAPNAIYIAQLVLFAILGLNYLTTQSALTAFQLAPGLRLVVLTINGLALAGLFGLYLVEATRLQTART